MCENAIKSLAFVTKYVPDCYRIQELSDKVILEHGGTVRFVPDCCKNKIYLCNVPVDNWVDPLELVPDCYKAEKMFNKSVDAYPFARQFVSKCYKTQVMW